MALMVALGIFLILASSWWVLAAIGWEVGMNVAVASTFALGFSVNYSTFIGVGFLNSKVSESRELRIRDVLMSTGPTIVGSTYTVVAAFCIFFLSQVTFYHKVATINICMIVLSALFSLTFFASFCCICAPMENFGSILAPFISLYRVFKRIREQKVGVDSDKEQEDF